MKKIYLFLSVIASLSVFSQKDYTRYYNSWRLGLNAGAAWQTADMRSCWGMAGGLTLEKGLGENATNFFSFAIRGRYLAANTYGMDYVRNYNVKDNDAYNGKYDLNVDYTDTAKYKLGYVYDNYKMTLGEGSLELQLTFNRLRERTHVLLNLWGGVGVTSYRTKTDLLDADGKLYDFSKVDSTGNKSKAITNYNALIDKKYESYAFGSKNGDMITFSPSAGIGLGYQFSPGFSMLLEYKVTLPQGTSADLLDGKFSNNSDAIGGNNDYYHYAGLNLLFTLRGKKKTQVVHDETVYTNTIVTTNTTAVTNSVTTTATVAPTNTLTNVVVPSEPKPIISFINPPVNGFISPNQQYKISAQVLNISNTSQLKFKFNNASVSNFNYNTQNHIFEYYSNLNVGTNYVQLTAANSAGTDNEATTVIYQQPKPTGNPPTVTITNPSACPTNVQYNQYNLTAYVGYVTANTTLHVLVNNKAVTNYVFNSSSGQLNLPLNLVNGANYIAITATSELGQDTKQCVITYTQPTQQTLPPPIITYINPANPGSVANNPTYTLKAQILNISDQTGASVYVNGMSVPFSYNTSSKQLSAQITLLNGSNPITIYANNSAGDDTKTTDIIYQQQVASGVPPQINLVNPSNSPAISSLNAYMFKLNVLNVTSKNDIQALFNGSMISGFTFNTITKEFVYSGILNQGVNTLFVKASNAYGIDTKTIQVNYQPKVVAKKPPLVIITNPVITPTVVTISGYAFKSTVSNMPNTNGLTVKFNGNIVTNYTYDGYNLNYNGILINGSNIFEVTAVNTDGSDSKNVSVVYRPKTASMPPPVVSLVNPSSQYNAANNALNMFAFKVINVSSKNDIQVKLNGAVISNFTYDLTTKNVNFSATMNPGSNTITVIGTNVSGSDFKEVYMEYKEAQSIKLPPVITLVNPLNSPSGSTIQAYTFKATVANIPNTSGLAVKYNGAVVTNYNYDGFNFSFLATLVQGNNILEIAANNNDGSDTKVATVNYKPKVVNVPAPIVNLVNPALPDNATDNPAYNYTLSVLNVNSKNDITVTFNGTVQTNFVYNTISKEVYFSATLNQGMNVLNVKGTNTSGSDSKTVNVTYEPHQTIALPPTVTFVNPSGGSGASVNPNYVFTANITNMPNTNGVTVMYNGSQITNYTYDGYNLGFSATLIQGNNTLEITAVNTDGTDTKLATVNYKPKVVITPPVVTITQPSNNATVHNSSCGFVFSATNVNQSQVQILLNGSFINSFNFISGNGNVTANLQVGQNTFMVKATNNGGTDMKSIVVNYEPVVETPETNTVTTSPTETTTTTPSNTTTTNPNSQRITICHYPPGNTGNPQTIQIPVNAWPAHQAHGDTQGACPANKSGNEIKVEPRKGGITPVENKMNQVTDTIKSKVTPINAPKRPR